MSAAVALLDQAGWHGARDLAIPGNVTLICRCRRVTRLNSVESVWHFLRDNWLSNRVFQSYNDILDQCCAAWNKLSNQPWKIMSIVSGVLTPRCLGGNSNTAHEI